MINERYIQDLSLKYNLKSKVFYDKIFIDAPDGDEYIVHFNPRPHKFPIDVLHRGRHYQHLPFHHQGYYKDFKTLYIDLSNHTYNKVKYKNNVDINQYMC